MILLLVAFIECREGGNPFVGMDLGFVDFSITTYRYHL